MSRSDRQLRADAERIWRAGVAAVSPQRLIDDHVHIDGPWLIIDDEAIDLRPVRKIAIVGAGKAAGALAAALEQKLGPTVLEAYHVAGWVNVPANGLVPTERIMLHPARPAGVNEPRPEGVAGARRILDIVAALGPNDLCVCLLTGGGSALLPAPAPPITLDEKIQITRLLSAAGANIEQLNTVRSQISLIKGGGLARASNAGRLVTLIISDVLGDRLESIASGPTVTTSRTTPAEALQVLEDLRLINDPSIASVVTHLRSGRHSAPTRPSPPASHHILANNAAAVDAAGIEAERLGYSHAMISATRSEGAAEEVGRHIAHMAVRMQHEPGPDCLISGGEPTVKLIDAAQRGIGGRNQQLALAALTALGDCEGIALLAGGTDGEDGPTDAAGAFVTADIVRAAREKGLDPETYLNKNDAYNFFRPTGGLFVTGPTNTNVCDLRVVTVAPSNPKLPITNDKSPMTNPFPPPLRRP